VLNVGCKTVLSGFKQFGLRMLKHCSMDGSLKSSLVVYKQQLALSRLDISISARSFSAFKSAKEKKIYRFFYKMN